MQYRAFAAHGSMIWVVLDTNVLVSALLTAHGLQARVLLRCLTGSDVQLCISADVYAEYEEVLHRPKFKQTDRQIEAILNNIRARSVWVRPEATVRACPDPDDDVFLECAEAAEADYVVTGNTKHFPVFWKGTSVVTARYFIETLPGNSERS